MFRGDRGIILAIAGLILIGAGQPPKPGAQTEYTNEQAEIAKSLSEISATLKSAQEPDKTTQPCDPKQDNRNSDLCAQWKAADAASNAADAAWQQFYLAIIGCILGAITMFAAIAAAFFARQAAQHTENSNAIAVVQARAHLVVYSIGAHSVDGRTRLILTIHNPGPSVAIISRIMRGFIDEGESATWPSNFLSATLEKPAFVSGAGADSLKIMDFPDATESPNILAGFIDYNTLTLQSRRTYFAFKMIATDHPEHPFNGEIIILEGQPSNT